MEITSSAETVLNLSRLQFALTIGFHYLFPPISIGLGLILVIMEGMFLKTGDKAYETMTKFWVKIFAIVFAIGVATGIVMEFQFGTNWAIYSRYVGDIFGSPLAAEGIFAFFLESGFLAILVFGWNRVTPRIHFLATCMVSLGSMFSAVWIIVANSWQQTPGEIGKVFHVIEHQLSPGIFVQRAEILDFWAVVFNPSTVDRLVHVLLAAFITGAFFVLSVSAWYLIKDVHVDFARRSFRIALPVALIASLLQAVSGHSSGQIVAEHQPAKLAAMEALYQTEQGAPLTLFGIPDSAARKVHAQVAIPGMLSWLAYNDPKAEVKGLDDPVFTDPETGEQNVPRMIGPIFWAFRVMVGVGMLFMLMCVVAVFHWWRGTLFQQRWLLSVFIPAVILPHIGNQLGWFVAEVGRQPWIVQGLLKTSQSFSPAVDVTEMIISLAMFFFIYAILFALFIFILDSRIKLGPAYFMDDGPKDAEDKAFGGGAS